MQDLINIGDIVKVHSWHGVVQDVAVSRSGRVFVKVLFVKNLFFGQNAELLELDIGTEVEPATVEALRAEIESRTAYQQRRIDYLVSLVSGETSPEP